MSKSNANAKFSGWRVAIGLAAIAFIGPGIYATVSQYITAICELYNFSRTGFTMWTNFFTIGQIVTNVFLFAIVSKKLGGKKMMLLAGVELCVGWIVYAAARNLPMFYLAGFLLGQASIWYTTAAISWLISNWFIKYRGLIIGIVSMATAFGGTVFNLFINNLTNQYGIQNTYYFMAVVGLLAGVIAFLLVPANAPEDIGQKPYGYGEEISEKKKSSKPAPGSSYPVEIPLKEGIKHGFFWFLMLGCFFGGTVAHPITTIVPAYLQDIGYDDGIRVAVFAALYTVIAIWKPILGFLFDKLGAKIMTFIGCALGIIGFLCLFYASTGQAAALYIFLFTYTAFNANQTVQLPLVTSATVGIKNIDTYVGIAVGALSVGSLVGVTGLNLICDICGSYVPGIIVAIVMAVVLFVLWSLALKTGESYRRSKYEAAAPETVVAE